MQPTKLLYIEPLPQRNANPMIRATDVLLDPTCNSPKTGSPWVIGEAHPSLVSNNRLLLVPISERPCALELLQIPSSTKVEKDGKGPVRFIHTLSVDLFRVVCRLLCHFHDFTFSRLHAFEALDFLGSSYITWFDPWLAFSAIGGNLHKCDALPPTYSSHDWPSLTIANILIHPYSNIFLDPFLILVLKSWSLGWP